MEKLPANAGWRWVKQGFALFRKQPAEISTLFLAYMFLMLALGFIPLLGQTLQLVLVPVLSMAFMQACANIEQGKKVYPNLLMTGFRQPVLGPLLQLGALYLVAALLSVGASALVDGGQFWSVMSGRQEMEPDTMRLAGLGMLVSVLVYIPFAMAFWYAAPLVCWKRMGVGKALFYSFFAVRRAGKAFLVYGLSWALIGVLLPALVSSLIALLMPKATVVMVVLLPLSVVLTVVMYCSFYPTYTEVFGGPEEGLPASGEGNGL
jgi:hypothetical protein